ncbi:hypothetical protein FQN60_010197 [Etheostoma spectabile]|uniref:Uncharacterized protein n=1 Tax=Etheostoma spectabile TaxID=54343 RepID=A0A5J5D2A5_9PERO|nr:hypothetical protein FQN60_010197 [Etheostoma spectabile]
MNTTTLTIKLIIIMSTIFVSFKIRRTTKKLFDSLSCQHKIFDFATLGLHQNQLFISDSVTGLISFIKHYTQSIYCKGLCPLAQCSLGETENCHRQPIERPCWKAGNTYLDTYHKWDSETKHLVCLSSI